MTKSRDIADSINRIDSSAADATAVTIDANENVGIGTSSPLAAGSSYTVVDIGSASTASLLNMTDNGTETGRIVAQDDQLHLSSGTASGFIGFRTGGFSSGNESMRINSSGNVAIGTSSPNSGTRLQVDGGNIRTNNRYLAGSTGVSTPDYSFSADGSMGMYRVPGSLCFATGGTERMRILSGGGLTFNGDTAAANALDDYEEGTFTVSAARLTGLTTNVGRYTKVGNLVTCEINLDWTSSDNSGSDVIFTGLPFTSVAGTDTSVGPAMIYGTDINTDVGAAVVLRIDDNQTRFFLNKAMDSAINSLNGADMNSATTLHSTFTYTAA